MSLPGADAAHLAERGIAYTTAVESGMVCVVLPGWPVPPGYNRTSVDLLVRLPAGFPDAAPDMWWVDPALVLADGSAVEATQITEVYLGRSWQRWSRHFSPGQWRPGIDGLETYLARIRGEMLRSTQQVAA
ncbi:E2/UBC family protein [Streptomyces sp. NPDC088847]|uniref:E2/UBC family protein n=1 Tax=Streptomyces sp. NPDC088847 TaxID=3365909 RepID=UPI00382059E3